MIQLTGIKIGYSFTRDRWSDEAPHGYRICLGTIKRIDNDEFTDEDKTVLKLHGYTLRKPLYKLIHFPD